MRKKGTSGWQHIYNAVKRIPRGHVVTYGQLARLLRVRGGARTVGYAMAGCPSGQGIPWHRVVGAGGKLLPREPYASKQRMLLETEGTQFIGMKVDLPAHQWNPRERGKASRKSPRRPKAHSRNRHTM
jgi:methylated-DNA-protein-cysteine methyltransferase-like protein